MIFGSEENRFFSGKIMAYIAFERAYSISIFFQGERVMMGKTLNYCLALLGVVVVIGATSRPAMGELLFSDSYYTDSASTDINEGLGVAGNGRTAGLYETATYYKNSDPLSLENGIMTMSDDAYCWIKENFNGDDSAGGLEITVKVNPNCGTEYGGWFGLGIGNDAYTGRALTSSLMFGFRGGYPYDPISDHPCQVIIAENGGPLSGIAPNWPEWSQDAVGNSYNELKFVITDENDGNPFDGSGVLHVALYVNGGTTDVLDYTSQSVYSDNYIGMEICLANGSFIDEISISKIPEPSTLALLASGLTGLLAYAWRKRK